MAGLIFDVRVMRRGQGYGAPAVKTAGAPGPRI